jgi:hypothetical protein
MPPRKAPIEPPAMPLASPPKPELPVEAPKAPSKPERPPMHPLDAAPMNSKIVVLSDGAVLSTPDGMTTLEKKDPANRLPTGAKISKVLSAEGETLYAAMQLNSKHPDGPSFHGSAVEAIAQYMDIHYQREIE